MKFLLLALSFLGWAADTVAPGPVTHPGCVARGNTRIRFLALPTEAVKPDRLHRKARELSRECDTTHEAGDRWFYWTRPETEPRALWLLWKNVDTGEYGFALAKLTGGVWEVTTNSGRVYAPRDDERQKLSWWTDGRRVDIDLFNPKNDKEWKAGDLWYRFGH